MDAEQLQTLHDELTGDPLGRGYSGMSDSQAADSLNTADRSISRATIQTWEIIEATVPAEYDALSAANKQRYQAFVSAGTLDPNGTNVVAAFSSMFAGTTTLTNLAELQTRPASRAEELGLPRVHYWDVGQARALGA